jgi:hypothetical protein
MKQKKVRFLEFLLSFKKTGKSNDVHAQNKTFLSSP